MTAQFTERLEKALPWSVLGLLLSLLIGVPGIYLALHRRAPLVIYEIQSIANVFNVHRPLPELTILFNGENIRDKGKNLQIVTLALRNQGDEDVLQGAYDNTQSFGLRLPNAQVIGMPRVVRGDNEYLLQHLNPRVSTSNVVEFNKVIIERGKSAIIEMVVLHDQSQALTFEPFGKIAGQDSIYVLDLRGDSKQSFWPMIIQGGAIVNIVRFSVSIALFIVGVILLIFITEGVSNIKQRRHKKKLQKYLAPILEKADERTKKVIDRLLAFSGIDGAELKACIDILADPAQIELIAQATQEQRSMQERTHLEARRIPTEKDFLIHLLIGVADDCLDKKEDGKYVARKEIVEALGSVMAYISTTPPPKGLK